MDRMKRLHLQKKQPNGISNKTRSVDNQYFVRERAQEESRIRETVDLIYFFLL